MMAKVSIVVPVFKVEKYLPNCVEHLIDQTLQDIEIILVDDGSPDRCPQICDDFSQKDSRIHVIHKSNAGVSAARNDGLKAATGDYVIFCDSDDWMEDNACEVLYQKAVETGSDVIIGDVYQVTEEERKKTTFYKDEFLTEDRDYIDKLIQADIYRTYCPNPPGGGPAFGYGGPWNKLVKRDVLISNNIQFDVRLKGIFDDIQYTAHVLNVSKSVCYIQAPVYNYRIIASSITHTYKPNVLEINEAIFVGWEEFFEKTGKRNTFEPAYYACVLRRIEESIRLYFVNPNNPKSRAELKREYKQILSKEPYRTAVRKVDQSKISKKQKMIAMCGRYGFTFPIWIAFK